MKRRLRYIPNQNFDLFMISYLHVAWVIQEFSSGMEVGMVDVLGDRAQEKDSFFLFYSVFVHDFVLR